MIKNLHRVNYDGTPNKKGHWWVWKETCDRCGKPIRTGKYCDQCKTKMANTLMSAFEKPAAPSANEFKGDGRMRYISDDK